MYIKKFKEIVESLNERSIPKILKEISLILKNDMDSCIGNFNKKYNIDIFNFNVKLNFNKDRYHSYIDLIRIITESSRDVDIEVDIPNSYDIDYVVAIVIHEMRHIYDIYTVNAENDMQSFIDERNIKKLRIGRYAHFINLVYLSLEHELIARNNMIYPFVGLKNINKEESIKIIKEVFIYKSLEELKNFNHIDFIKSINLPELIDLTNLFIGKIAKDDKLCKTAYDINNFYKKWEDYFKNVSIEWKLEMNKEIDKIYEFKTAEYSESIFGGTHRLFLNIYNEIFNT